LRVCGADAPPALDGKVARVVPDASREDRMPVNHKSRLSHKTPGWVSDVAIFHIRIRCAADNPHLLTDSDVGAPLLESVRVYTEKQFWSCYLFLLMPDHLHGLFSFARDRSMSGTVRAWKRYHTIQHGISWQENCFDHRIRNEQEFSEKYAYIERNPVVKGLCECPSDWQWKLASWHQDARALFL
jgi:putative transposase